MKWSVVVHAFNDEGEENLNDRRLFASKPSSSRTARKFVLDAVRRCAHKVDEEVLVLLVTEIVTNAISHGGGGPIEVAVKVDRGLRVEVTDRNALELPRVLHADLKSVGGRGMLIVEKLAHRWGAHPVSDGGKVVWFELEAQDSRPE